jgi:hypothetical protein
MQLEQQQKAVDQLLGNTRVLEGKLAEARSKKDTLKVCLHSGIVCWLPAAMPSSHALESAQRPADGFCHWRRQPQPGLAPGLQRVPSTCIVAHQTCQLMVMALITSLRIRTCGCC